MLLRLSHYLTIFTLKTQRHQVLRVNIKKYTVHQSCMSLSTYYLECGRHVARLHRRRCRRRRAYAPTSNTAVCDNHEKIHTWVSFSHMVMGLRLAALRAAGALL